MRKISLNPSIIMVFSLFVLGACHGDPEQKASVCGNEVIENGEFCDGDQFGQASCVSEGFAAGALACTAACEIDTAGCIPIGCGDGAALDGEHCDGADLRGKTCEDRGFLGGGTLACNADCTYNVEGCSVSDEGYTSGVPCEIGLPCWPVRWDMKFTGPQVCVADPVEWTTETYSTCLYSCERNEDCALGMVCLQKDGYSYCETEQCDVPYEACTLATGHPGRCTPTGFAAYEEARCMPAGSQAHGESCIVDDFREDSRYGYPLFAFEYVAEELCASGECRSNDLSAQDPNGTCKNSLCDALAVLEGRMADPCPESHNCMNTSVIEYNGPGQSDLLRSANHGACIPMEISEPELSGVACHVLTQLTSRTQEACPSGQACFPWLTVASGRLGFIGGSLQGFCGEVSATPLGQGEACAGHSECGAGTACVMADPFAVTDQSEYTMECRKICDATVYDDNPACAGLPEGTTWVCLTVSRIFTPDHELGHSSQPDYFDYVETHPSPLGFCVPDRI